MSFIIIFCSIATVFSILFVIIKPYKPQYSVYNTITVVFFLLALGISMLFIGLFVSEIIHDQQLILLIIGGLFGIIPPLYVVALAVWWIWKHNPMKLKLACLKKIRVSRERSMTTATLFNAADTRSKNYGTVN